MAKHPQQLSEPQKTLLRLAPGAGEGVGRLVADKLTAEPDFAQRMVEAVMVGLVAESRCYDMGKREMMTYPDCKTRLAAFNAAMAHLVGEPVKRIQVLQVAAGGETDAERMGRLLQSPAVRESLQAALNKAAAGESTGVIDLG